MTLLSVVIPARNAAAVVAGCLEALAPARAAGVVDQVILVDGGSRDDTASVAAAHGARVLATDPGRGRQLAAGARAASGDWLLFLHADTRLSPGWTRAAAAFMDSRVGAETAAVFRLAFDEDTRGARRTAGLANWRTRRLGLPYGDQGLLIGRALYNAVGGYPDMPLMEDVALARRLGRGRLQVLDAEAITSAARYRRDGWWWRSTCNLSLLSLYFLGLPPRVLKRLYG
jgi:rSAM/selenodomain-associated transferase 2